MAFNAALGYRTLFKKDETGELRQITVLLEETGYREGYASFWNGNVITELSNGAIVIRCWGSTTSVDWRDIAHVYPWLQAKAHGCTTPQGAFFLLFTSAQAETNTIARQLDEQRIIYRSDNYVIYGYDDYQTLLNGLQGG